MTGPRAMSGTVSSRDVHRPRNSVESRSSHQLVLGARCAGGSPRRESTTWPFPLGDRPRSSWTLPRTSARNVHVLLIAFRIHCRCRAAQASILDPLLVRPAGNSTFNSNLTVPPRQIRKLLTYDHLSGVVSPTMTPFSARQKWDRRPPAQGLAVDSGRTLRVVAFSLREETAAATPARLARCPGACVPAACVPADRVAVLGGAVGAVWPAGVPGLQSQRVGSGSDSALPLPTPPRRSKRSNSVLTKPPLDLARHAPRCAQPRQDTHDTGCAEVLDNPFGRAQPSRVKRNTTTIQSPPGTSTSRNAQPWVIASS